MNQFTAVAVNEVGTLTAYVGEIGDNIADASVTVFGDTAAVCAISTACANGLLCRVDADGFMFR